MNFERACIFKTQQHGYVARHEVYEISLLYRKLYFFGLVSKHLLLSSLFEFLLSLSASFMHISIMIFALYYMQIRELIIRMMIIE